MFAANDSNRTNPTTTKNTMDYEYSNNELVLLSVNFGTYDYVQ